MRAKIERCIQCAQEFFEVETPVFPDIEQGKLMFVHKQKCTQDSPLEIAKEIESVGSGDPRIPSFPIIKYYLKCAGCDSSLRVNSTE